MKFIYIFASTNFKSNIMDQENELSSEDENVGTAIPVNLLISEAYELLQKSASRTDGISGIASGFNELDKITSGWQNGDLIVFGSRPSMGKTALELSMAVNIAVNYKTPVGLFSLEMNNVQLSNRLIVNVCELHGEKIKNGQIAPYEWQQLDYNLKYLVDAPIYIDDTAWMKIDDLCEKIRNMVIEKGVKIIFIDYLQRLYTEIKYIENRYSELNYFTRCLKSLAIELNIPIIVLSQLNRSLENREGIDGKRPQLTDLRDSGTICDDADVICFIHRPEYYHIYTDEKGNDTRGTAEVIIAKQRNGATGDVILQFEKDYAKFKSL
jgi:replicative DNA helicase